MGKRTIKIGTRGSKLALWQSNWVKSELERRFPGLTAELFVIKTKGDKILDVPLAKVGGKGLFVKEIEEAILDRRVDIAVHSMKDMPGEVPEGLCIGAIPERENPHDAFVSLKWKGLNDLPKNARVGTSSLRRAAQLKRIRPDIRIETLRGNIDTRLNKLETGDFDAIILAAAGLLRMELGDRITEYLDEDAMLPAVGQGALSIESRLDDPEIVPLMAEMDHSETRTVVLAERAFLHRLEGGCQVPIAAHGRLKGDRISLTGLVSSLDGDTIIKDTFNGPAEDAQNMGVQLAEALLDRGAKAILDALMWEE